VIDRLATIAVELTALYGSSAQPVPATRVVRKASRGE
jgi:hypothetical protein